MKEDLKVVEQSVKDVIVKLNALKGEIRKVIVGQEETIDQLLITFLAGGHALLEGVPGLAKTLMIRTLADAIDLRFRRIQFTPDLMPSDIIGTEILEEDHTTGKRFFKFNKAQSSPILFWRMRLTVHRLKHKRPYLRPCRSLK